MQMRHAWFTAATLFAATGARGAELPNCESHDYFACARSEYERQHYPEALLLLRKVESQGDPRTRCAIALVLTVMRRYEEASSQLNSCAGLHADGFLDAIIDNHEAYRPTDAGTVAMDPSLIRTEIKFDGGSEEVPRLLELSLKKDPVGQELIVYSALAGDSTPPRLAIWVVSGRWLVQSLWQVGNVQLAGAPAWLDVAPGGAAPSTTVLAPAGNQSAGVVLVNEGDVQPLSPNVLGSLYARVDVDSSELAPRGGAIVLGAAWLLRDWFQPIVSVGASPRLFGGWAGAGAYFLRLGATARVGAIAGAPFFLWNFADDGRLPARTVGVHAALALRWTPEFPQSFFVAAGAQHYPFLEGEALSKTLFVLSIGAERGFL